MGDDCCDDECCGENCGGENNTAIMMMHMANAAWNELMVQKMKAVYEKKRGASMDKAAEVAVEHSIAFWNARLSGEELTEDDHKEYEKKLTEALQS